MAYRFISQMIEHKAKHRTRKCSLYPYLYEAQDQAAPVPMPQHKIPSGDVARRPCCGTTMTSIGDPNQIPHCPDCGSGDVLSVGKIPPARGFAGVLLPKPINGGFLWRCGACHLVFRWPTLDKVELDALYAAGANDNWNSSAITRRDWCIARKWLDEMLPESSSILDVGCFDGRLLDFLGKAYRRYGIEIHAEARRRAEDRGISIVGTDLESPSRLAEPVDCVTAFDVIEHVHRPARFLEYCRDLVKPGGRILIATGNADASSFRFMGAGYWYCTVAEHLSFVSPRWSRNIADELGLTVEKQVMFSHGRRDLLDYPPQLLKNILYRITPGFFGWLRKHGFGNADVKAHPEIITHPPRWTTAKDHFLVLFRKR